VYHHLNGTLERKSPAQVVLDVGGVGYVVTVPLSTYERLPAEGEPVRLLTTFVVREDSHRLFGFLREEERAFFGVLQAVSGVGPQVALGIVSSMPLVEFRAAVSAGDATRLQRVKGVGRRLSERLVVELKDRLGDVGEDAPQGSATADDRDAVLALEALGFTPAQAERAVAQVRAGKDSVTDAGDLVRRALRAL